MKKILLTATALVFGMVGSASALLFSDTQIVDITLAEGPVAGSIFPSSATYSHATPGDFEVPWDIVNSATLTISGYWIDDNNDTVAVEGTTVGTLTPGGFNFLWWDVPSFSSFDIVPTFSSWSTGADFDVTLSANGSFLDGVLYVNSSTFELDYENQTAPVPEPSTMLLFGVGALGLLGYSRKRSSKKA